MQTKKMSLANIQGKLSRTEMKNIMAGSCVTTYVGCNGTTGGGATCDYNIACDNGYNQTSCGLQCKSAADGSACRPPAQK